MMQINNTQLYMMNYNDQKINVKCTFSQNAVFFCNAESCKFKSPFICNDKFCLCYQEHQGCRKVII